MDRGTSATIVLLALIASGCAHTSVTPALNPVGAARLSGGSTDRGEIGPDIKQGNTGSHWVVVSAGITQHDQQTMLTQGQSVLTLDQRQYLVTLSLSGGVLKTPVPNCGRNGTSPTAFAINNGGTYFINGASGSASQPAVLIGPSLGSLTCYSLGGDGIGGHMVALPDGSVWGRGYTHLIHVFANGTYSAYPYPNGENTNGDLALGPDGNLWMPRVAGALVSKIDPSTGAILATYDLSASNCGYVAGIAAVSGSLWVGCGTDAIVKLSTSGVQTQYVVHPNGFPAPFPYSITQGSDGNPWFTMQKNASVGTIDRKTGKVTVIPLPGGYSDSSSVTTGPDGNLWFLADAPSAPSQILVYVPQPLTVSPATLSFPQPTGSQTLTVSEAGRKKWTALSSNARIVSVKQSGPPNTFSVSAHAAGNAIITVRDAVGNYVQVPVTVK
jgi:streptogramin lyase